MSKELICYCFNHTAQEIEADARKHGRSTIMEAIMAAKKAGGCQCAAKNPSGR